MISAFRMHGDEISQPCKMNLNRVHRRSNKYHSISSSYISLTPDSWTLPDNCSKSVEPICPLLDRHDESKDEKDTFPASPDAKSRDQEAGIDEGSKSRAAKAVEKADGELHSEQEKEMQKVRFKEHPRGTNTRSWTCIDNSCCMALHCTCECR